MWELLKPALIIQQKIEEKKRKRKERNNSKDFKLESAKMQR